MDKIKEELEKEIVKEVMDEWKKGNITFIKNAFRLAVSKTHLATKTEMIKEFEKMIDKIFPINSFYTSYKHKVEELKQKLGELRT